MLKLIPKNISIIIRVYIVTLICFTIFRIMLFISESGRISDLVSRADILKAFIMGIRFDIVICGYLLVLPYVLISIFYYLKLKSELLRRGVFAYVFAVFTLAFLVCSINIPYFNQFFSQFSVTAFEWADSPLFVMKMIAEEPRYWLYIVPFIILIIVFYRILKRSFSKENYFYEGNVKTILNIVISIVFAGMMLIGIRGRLDEKSPIRVGTAYFCNNAFLNQLGLNPNFTLIRSYLDSRKEENIIISLMDNKEAVANVQSYLNIKVKDKHYPLRREIVFGKTKPSKYNVVVIIMESMSAAKMSRHGNPNNLTAFLDSISKEGYYFENIYTSGIHTFNGVFSTLFSFPALFRQHPMKESNMVKYHGIASTLKMNNYSTIYFTTHDGQFDNIEGFLKANDFDRVVTKDDYPGEEVKTTLGVPDDYMFRFSIPILNELSRNHKPFLSVFMTASDHGPYYIPEYFKPKNDEIKNQIVEYADYSLERFVKLASKQKWFDNTLFVFIADHGAAMDELYDMSLDYNHTPLIFYGPKIIKDKKVYSNIGGQIDVFPSIMGMLKIPYENNTLGVNLFKENRPYIYFNADDKYGVIDNDWFFISRKDSLMSLYKYRAKDMHDYLKEQPEIVKKMKTYAESNLQTYQYILKKHKQ